MQQAVKEGWLYIYYRDSSLFHASMGLEHLYRTISRGRVFVELQMMAHSAFCMIIKIYAENVYDQTNMACGEIHLCKNFLRL